jgi:hypothetical protein
VAYTIDKYLAVVFGRPRLYHDEDIDQDFPDCVNDEDMTPQGRAAHEPQSDCHMDSLINHAKIAQLIDRISRDVYSIKKVPKRERLASAHKFGQALHEWREALPHHLGTVRPSSLIPAFRRQATAMKLAYCHAIMHANRPFLLGATGGRSKGNNTALEDSVRECISAARTALETVDAMAIDGALFHAYWWTPYVTFCALAVVYVWEIQQVQARQYDSYGLHDLLELAEKCQNHLARATAPDSPSHRYSVILEELRQEAKNQTIRAPWRGQRPDDQDETPTAPDTIMNEVEVNQEQAQGYTSANQTMEMSHQAFEGGSEFYGTGLLDTWETTDWLDLDSSVSAAHVDHRGMTLMMVPTRPSAPFQDLMVHRTNFGFPLRYKGRNVGVPHPNREGLMPGCCLHFLRTQGYNARSAIISALVKSKAIYPMLPVTSRKPRLRGDL